MQQPVQPVQPQAVQMPIEQVVSKVEVESPAETSESEDILAQNAILQAKLAEVSHHSFTITIMSYQKKISVRFCLVYLYRPKRGSPVSGPLLSVKKPLIFLITTASSTSERLQPFSQGAPQTLPHIEAKGFVARDIAYAFS